MCRVYCSGNEAELLDCTVELAELDYPSSGAGSGDDYYYYYYYGGDSSCLYCNYFDSVGVQCAGESIASRVHIYYCRCNRIYLLH